MIYLTIFWYGTIIFLALYFGSVIFKSGRLKLFLENNGALLVIVAAVLIIMAIITKDPVTILGVSIPSELQWLGSLLATAFGMWRFYLNPLKLKVYSMDREVGELKSNISNVKADVRLIKEKLLGRNFKTPSRL